MVEFKISHQLLLDQMLLLEIRGKTISYSDKENSLLKEISRKRRFAT